MKAKFFLSILDNTKIRASIILALVFCLGAHTCVYAQDSQETSWGNFQNILKLPPGTNRGSIAFFSGHVSTVSSAPQGGGFKLLRSSFGQTVAQRIPYPNFQTEALTRAEKMLYYEKADESGPYAKEDAAFRYKVKLYGEVEVGEDDYRVTALFEDMGDYWTNDQRNRAQDAVEEILKVLRYDPLNKELRNTLLDIYYDIATAELILISEKLVELEKVRMGIGYAPSPGEFLIDEQIRRLDEILPLYDNAVKPYFELLSDNLGVCMAEVDPSAAAQGIRFGYYMFCAEVPNRSLYAGYRESGGDLVPVVDDDADGEPDILFEGFKDLVLIFKIQKGAAEAAAELARLYALRGAKGDADEARSLIGEAQRKFYTDGLILNGLFTSEQLQNIDPSSNLKAIRAGWSRAVAALSNVKTYLEGNGNPLGLGKDFLVLVQTDLPQGGSETNDSYDYFEEYLIPDETTPSGPLGDAYNKYLEAKNAYENFRVYQDTIQTELANIRDKYGARLREIVGAEYKLPPDYDEINPEYLTPFDNEGGELYIQLKNIELAKLRIQKNQAEIANIHKEIQIKLELEGRLEGLYKVMAQTYVEFANVQVALSQLIASIEANQKEAEARSELLSGIIEGIANEDIGTIFGSFMTYTSNSDEIDSDRFIDFLQGLKELLAGIEKGKITLLEGKIEAAKLEAEIKTLLLRMTTLAIESMEAAVMMDQEMAKLRALLDEAAYLEAKWNEAEKNLASRYFADPSHRIIMNDKIIEARHAFDRAQLWVYIMARALDYKWNTHVQADWDDYTYTAKSAFAMMNAGELLEMAKALRYWDETHLLGNRGGETFHKFSLREDFLGYRRYDIYGNELYYADPVTGKKVNAIQAFRSYLKDVAAHYHSQNGGMSFFGEVVRIEFSTNKPNWGNTFFSTGHWNEKIKWVSVKINSSQYFQDSSLAVWLEQRGNGYLRNEAPGVVEDPERPDRVKGEFTVYPIKYWWIGQDGKWHSKDSFGFTIDARVGIEPDAPPGTWQKKEFHEMPAGVSDWVLEIPTTEWDGTSILDYDSINDIEVWFADYYLQRH